VCSWIITNILSKLILAIRNKADKVVLNRFLRLPAVNRTIVNPLSPRSLFQLFFSKVEYSLLRLLIFKQVFLQCLFTPQIDLRRSDTLETCDYLKYAASSFLLCSVKLIEAMLREKVAVRLSKIEMDEQQETFKTLEYLTDTETEGTTTEKL